MNNGFFSATIWGFTRKTEYHAWLPFEPLFINLRHFDVRELLIALDISQTWQTRFLLKKYASLWIDIKGDNEHKYLLDLWYRKRTPYKGCSYNISYCYFALEADPPSDLLESLFYRMLYVASKKEPERVVFIYIIKKRVISLLISDISTINLKEYCTFIPFVHTRSYPFITNVTVIKYEQLFFLKRS